MSGTLRSSLAGTAILVLVAAGCGGGEATPRLPTEAAPPQQAELGWEEQLPETGAALAFRVYRFAVTKDGWEADVEVENRTEIPWRLPGAVEAVPTSFGVMLFVTDELGEVEQRSTDGDLPGLREAQRYEPGLPARLAPGARWRGVIGARGSLAAGLYVRVVLGPFVAVGDPPDGMQAAFSWITDHAHRLQR
jgi:hypothetical protein